MQKAVSFNNISIKRAAFSHLKNKVETDCNQIDYVLQSRQAKAIEATSNDDNIHPIPFTIR